MDMVDVLKILTDKGITVRTADSMSSEYAKVTLSMHFWNGDRKFIREINDRVRWEKLDHALVHYGMSLVAGGWPATIREVPLTPEEAEHIAIRRAQRAEQEAAQREGGAE